MEGFSSNNDVFDGCYLVCAEARSWLRRPSRYVIMQPAMQCFLVAVKYIIGAHLNAKAFQATTSLHEAHRIYQPAKSGAGAQSKEGRLPTCGNRTTPI